MANFSHMSDPIFATSRDFIPPPPQKNKKKGGLRGGLLRGAGRREGVEGGRRVWRRRCVAGGERAGRKPRRRGSTQEAPPIEELSAAIQALG